MFHPDTEANRQLVREHQAELSGTGSGSAPASLRSSPAAAASTGAAGCTGCGHISARPIALVQARDPLPRRAGSAHGRRIGAGNPRQVVECLILPRAHRPTAQLWLDRKRET